MRRKRTVAISWALVLLWGLVPVSLAQRGMGDASGVVRQGLKTEKMPQGHYNAITVTLDNRTIRLRDPNLRSAWAGQAPLRTL